jgi:hypothetical protein
MMFDALMLFVFGGAFYLLGVEQGKTIEHGKWEDLNEWRRAIDGEQS